MSLALGGCDVTAPPSGLEGSGQIAQGTAQGALPAESGGGNGAFKGDLDLAPAGCEASGKCKLAKTLAYVDSRGVGWEAEKGNLTDGASIPGWAKPVVGEAFDPAFVKAAIIHDHYCDRHVRTWQETHWVFYDALRTNGVAEDKAKLMYFAVLVGGPKWEKLDPGKACAAGANCQKALVPEMLDSRSTLVTKGNTQLLVRPASYNDQRFSRDMKAAAELISKNPQGMTLAQIEQLARKSRPGDYYLASKAGVQ